MLRATALILALICGAPSAWGWGADGHAIIAEIAQRRLTPAAAADVAALLGPGTSLASVASWADDERTRNRATARWHFVDIPLAEQRYDPARDCAAGPEGDCILAAIDRERAVVACAAAPAEQRQRALKFLVHFLGDLHQPLHALHEERGGNGVTVTIVTREGVNGSEPFNTNLHAAWDEGLIRRTTWSWGAYVDRLEAGFLRSADAAAMTQGTVIDWAEESHAVAAQLFGAVPVNRVLDDAYRIGALPDLDRQLALGGLRLARTLNDAFAVAACP